MKTALAWLKASRVASQTYIFLPLLFGQAYFVSQGGKLDWYVLVLAHLFGLFNQLYIVYANDYADIEADRLNMTFNIFSGGSRVLIDGDLRPVQLKNATLVMVGLNLLCGIALIVFYHRWLALPLIMAGIVLLWMYSYPPFKLSYRGGGELLQIVGVGVVLPLLGYYAQAGKLIGFSWLLFLTILPTQLACAMATSLPDEPSDRLANKQTASVLLGSHATKLAVIGLNFISILVFPWVAWLEPGDDRVWLVLAVPILANAILCFFNKSQPGSLTLTIFNFFAVLVTLSLMCGMTVAAFSMSS